MSKKTEERVYDPMTDTWVFPKLTPPTPWRDRLTPDEAAMVAEARATAERWAGMQNNSPLILIDKLAALLDGSQSILKDGK